MNKERNRWGDEPYRKDMNFSLCKQAEPTDEYGTSEEIKNAIFYYDVYLEKSFCYNSIQLLVLIQKGMSDEKFKKYNLSNPDNRHGMRKIGDAQEIANKVHTALDWLRATEKRKWDRRPLNPMRQMLDYCIIGSIVNEYNELHYDEDPER